MVLASSSIPVRFRTVVFSLVTVCLLFSLYWAPHFHQFLGFNTFITGDAQFALGLALLAGGLFCLVPLPHFSIQLSGRTIGVLLFVTVLCFLGFAVYINRNVLHSFMNSADEHSCYFFAECLRMGRLWVEPHPLSEFFNVVHVGNKGGKWFSVYPPGWPLIFAFGLGWGIQDYLNPLMSALALIFFFLAGKKIFGASAALTGLGLAAFTPFFAFTSASYFSHSTSLLMISIFLYGNLKWHEAQNPKSQILWAGIAALASGYGLMTRYLSMAAVMAPFIIYRLLRLVQKRDRWTKAETIFTAVLGLMMALIFLHNFSVSGNPLKAPNKYDKSWERLGFKGEYSVKEGLIHIMARFFYLMDWTPPFYIAFFVYSLFQKRPANPLRQIFRYSFFTLVFVYFLYFSWGGNQYGPRYYYEGFALLMLAWGDAFVHAWNSEGHTRKFLTGALVVSLATNFYQLDKHARFFEAASRHRKALYDFAEQTLKKPSVVLIQGFLGKELVFAPEDTVRNHPALNARILYAHDRGDENIKLKDFYPDREFYQGSYDRPNEKAVLVKWQSEANAS